MNKSKIPVWSILIVEIMIVIFVLFLMIKLNDASILSFIDIWNFIFILLPAVPILFVSGMGKDFALAFTIGRKDCALLQMKKSSEAVGMVQKLVLCGTAFSVTINLISLFNKLREPDEIGPTISVILLSVFYGLVLEFMLIPLNAYIESCIIDAMDLEDEGEEGLKEKSRGINHRE